MPFTYCCARATAASEAAAKARLRAVDMLQGLLRGDCGGEERGKRMRAGRQDTARFLGRERVVTLRAEKLTSQDRPDLE